MTRQRNKQRHIAQHRYRQQAHTTTKEDKTKTAGRNTATQGANTNT